MTQRPLLPALLLAMGLLALAASAGCAPADEAGSASSGGTTTDGLVPVDTFLTLFDPDPAVFEPAADRVFADFRPGYTAMLIEASTFGDHRRVILDRLGKATGQDFQDDPIRAYRWLWDQKIEPHPAYAEFKATLYRQIDPDFAAYFEEPEDARIRLDEIRWGGVARDGIPPLVNPTMLTADEASYLDDDNVVFGVFLNGDARAYPKRILAWHEMFRDTVGGVSVNGVYCTLCGSMILYETLHEGTEYTLGTSGFLYRSNKLMYDHATESLWSTLRGEPVVGPLVGQGIRLDPRFAVTTTWGQWRERHPETTVLSLATGHRRDYSEGAAYRDYFATDRLMFDVPFDDTRLKNKDEILALRFGEDGPPLAIDVRHLSATPVHEGTLGGVAYVIFTDPSGASRVYASERIRFAAYDGLRSARDVSGGEWQVTEEGLVGPEGARLARLPAHRAFWFGWHAAHPETELVLAEAS